MTCFKRYSSIVASLNLINHRLCFQNKFIKITIIFFFNVLYIYRYLIKKYYSNNFISPPSCKRKKGKNKKKQPNSSCFPAVDLLFLIIVRVKLNVCLFFLQFLQKNEGFRKKFVKPGNAIVSFLFLEKKFFFSFSATRKTRIFLQGCFHFSSLLVDYHYYYYIYLKK